MNVPENTAVRVMVASPDAQRRQVFNRFLSQKAGLIVAAEAASPDQALSCLESSHVDVVVIINEWPAVELTKKLRESDEKVRVVMVTATNTPEDIFAALDAGADGYVLNDNYEGLELAIRSVRLGTVWLDPGIAQQVFDSMVTSCNLKADTHRILPTGVMRMPLAQQETELLKSVAASSCTDGVCMVDPAFVRKLRRYAPGAV